MKTYKVELSILDQGAVLSVNESRHDKYLSAFNRAKLVASEYAKRYGFDVKPITGGFFLVQDQNGRTLAQTAVRS